MANETKTFTPASYDTSYYSYASVGSSLSNAVGKSHTNTTYAQWNLKTGSRAQSYVYYKFDLSAIPSDAKIVSVGCQAKAYINNTQSSRISSRQVQMYYGTGTAKGSAYTISTSTTAFSITCGTWTRSELNDCRIRIYAMRGTSSTTTTYYERFYGATLTVVYELPNKDTFMVKTGGTWNALNVTKVYKKVGGVWVEQTDLKTVFSTEANYVQGE